MTSKVAPSAADASSPSPDEKPAAPGESGGIVRTMSRKLSMKEAQETAKEISGEHAGVAKLYIVSSLKLTLVFAAVGVAVGAVPMSLFTYSYADALVNEVRYLGANLATILPGGYNSTEPVLDLIRCARFNENSGTWSPRDFEDEDTKSHGKIWFAYFLVWQTLGYTLAFLLIGLGWFGWPAVKKARAFEVFGIGSASVYVILNAWVWLGQEDLANPLGKSALRAGFYVLAVATSFYAMLGPSDQKRKWTLIPALLGTAIINIVANHFLTSCMEIYFNTNSTFVERIIAKSFALPFVKYVYTFVMAWLSQRFEVKNDSLYFLMLILPISISTCVGHSMQLAAKTYGEATTMSLIGLVMEISEYNTYIKGFTQVGSNFTFLAAIWTSATGWFKKELTEEQKQSEKQGKEIYMKMMTNTAVALMPIEVTSLTMNAVFYMMVPLNMTTLGGEPMSNDIPKVAMLWFISCVVEVMIPAYLVAVGSSYMASRNPERYGNVWKCLTETFERKTIAKVMVIAIMGITLFQCETALSLCAQPKCEGGGLYALTICPDILEPSSFEVTDESTLERCPELAETSAYWMMMGDLYDDDEASVHDMRND
uniref:Uncharacterized protein n=1 Tax=Florenciella parvula TaxID=236787 RepID=A0A7S2CID0_9STRA|eukprot:CAMPEP_0182523036 /NCGR_PEP_ID=MMETSP1323-20130603/737_1 /TAXON_ID=236787 /ORGANISM="Florenciella parvula, Strain RCC1693" /LENGTH=596 /DNA_ID=CAMNT_0024731299 /DNA_START=63 /DNA_END=1853 /DNA_ORIENTATION=-